MSDAPVRFSRVRIEGLFDPDAPPIDIQFNLEERVTILHGRNGSGKTITLSLLDALRRGDLQALVKAPFERFTVETTDDSRIVFEKTAASAGEASDTSTPRNLAYRVSTRGGAMQPTCAGTIEPRTKITLQPTVLSDATQLRAVARTQYGRPGDILTVEAFASMLPPVKFVSADRLFVPLSTDGPTEGARSRVAVPLTGPELMVERLSQDIREHVQAADKQYRLTATQLDNVLRHRLVEATTTTYITLDELTQRYAALADEEDRLRDLGLFRETSPPVRPDSFTEQNRNLLAILLEDNEKKLEPFRTLADRAQRLLTTLNRKLAPKSVKLDVETGYHVAAADGRPLPLEKLSSGEQHELVLLHELLFEAEPGSLILIDEPELSLHPTWQAEFLPDVLAIAELSDLDFVLATHSPYIIGDRTDLMVRLGEPFDERA